MGKLLMFKKGQVVGPNHIKYIEPRGFHTDPSGRLRYLALFECHCGKEFIARVTSIKSGHTKSCNCKHIFHGLSTTPDYSLWKRIKKRCFRVTCKKYKDYGGRGITMYEPWVKDPVPFIEYVSNLPKYNIKGLTLDRVNNEGNYEPGNLRWATASEQTLNRRPFKKR